MRVATWNINSIRIRLGLLKRLAELSQPDVVCLQETKVEDGLFPCDAVKTLGFPHLLFSGQKSYNGVAILSKLPLEPITPMTLAGSDDKRHIAALLPGGLALHNFYVPAGGDIPDSRLNPSFDFKLRFIEAMTVWSKAQQKTAQKTVILGDFNIAPGEHDVWSHKQLANVVSHTEPEITRLNALQESGGWRDTARHFVDAKEKLYSWWSYRNRDWRKSDRGRRLDHIWVTPTLAQSLVKVETLKDARDWESPSDHVPVIATFAL